MVQYTDTAKITTTYNNNRLKLKRINRIRYGKSMINEVKYFMSCGEDRNIYLWKHFSDNDMDRLNSINDNKNINSFSLSSSLDINDDDDNFRCIKPLKIFSGYHGYEILDIDICNDNTNSIFASCGIDKSIFIWDVKNSIVIRELKSIENFKTNSISFLDSNVSSAASNGSNIIASGSDDKLVKLWDLRNRSAYQPIQILDDATDSITHVIIAGDLIIASSADGRIRQYDVRKGTLSIDHISNQPVSFISISNDRKKILASTLGDPNIDISSANSQAVLNLIDINSGKILKSFMGHENNYFKVGNCFDNTDENIITGSEDGSLFIFDAKTCHLKQKIQYLSPEKLSISDVSFHPTKQCLITSAHDGICRVLA